jgi:predicted dehydrogenase
LNQEVTIFKKTGNKILKEKVKVKKVQPLNEELESFIECVQHHKKPMVSGVEGRRALQVALAIIEKINPSAKAQG